MALLYLAFLQSKNQHPIPAYSFWEYYLKNGIEEGGWQWTEGNVDWAEGLVYHQDKTKLEAWKATTWEKTITDIKNKHAKEPITLFLSYLFPHQVDGPAIREIQKLGIPCVNFFCDDTREFKTIPRIYKVFDLHWVPEYKALHMYKKAGMAFLHLPMPMWVHPNHRNIASVETDEICFIGSRDIQRWLLFENLLSKYKIHLSIYGAGWTSPNVPNVSKESPSIRY